MQQQAQNLMQMPMLNTRILLPLSENFQSKVLFVSTVDYLLIVLKKCMVKTWLMNILTFLTTILYIRMTRQTSLTIALQSPCILGLLAVQPLLVATLQHLLILRVSAEALSTWYSWYPLCLLELAQHQSS